MTELRYAVVIPSLGRPSLRSLLDALAAAEGPRPEWLVVVDDRAVPSAEPVVDVAMVFPSASVMARMGESAGT